MDPNGYFQNYDNQASRTYDSLRPGTYTVSASGQHNDQEEVTLGADDTETVDLDVG